jgi:hypothetical protein
MLDKAILLDLQLKIQAIIDNIASKEFKSANTKLEAVNNELETLLDSTTNDEVILELSKYQMLAEHLSNKINTAE